MAHEPIELMLYPNHPKEVRVRAEKEAHQAATKRIAREKGWKYKSLTQEDAKIIGANMVDWFLENPEADNLWDYLLNREPYSPSQIYDMQHSVPELRESLSFIYGLIGARAQKGWKEADARRYYAKMFEVFSPEHKQYLKETKAFAVEANIPTEINFISSYPNG